MAEASRASLRGEVLELADYLIIIRSIDYGETTLRHLLLKRVFSHQPFNFKALELIHRWKPSVYILNNRSSTNYG